MDIFREEGLWFCDPDWCISNEIPVYSFYQKPGDFVILGSGAEHWVKS